MQQEDQFFTGYKGTKLFYRIMKSTKDPVGVIIYVHGHGDHSGGFEEVSKVLADEGYHVYSFDLRGHGRSPGVRGYIKNWEEYREDLQAFCVLVEKEQQGLPLFLIGHSLGGLIGMEYVLNHGEGLAGLVTIAPAVAFEPSWFEKMLIHVVGVIKPDYVVENSDNYLQLTADSDRIKKLEKDQLRHNNVTPGLGRSIIKTISRVNEQAHQIQIPFLMQLGDKDNIISPRKMEELFEKVGSNDKKKIVYTNMRHRPFDDVDRELFQQDLLKWLSR